MHPRATRAALCFALLPIAAAPALRAQGLSVTPAVVSDYNFRGITQTANDPAAQIGLYYTVAPFRAGVWASNVKFTDSTGFYDSRHTEIRLLADAFGGNADTLRYAAGIVYYTYPGWSIHFPEVWGSVAHRWFSVALHYSWDYGSLSQPSGFGFLPGYTASAYYLEGNADWPIGTSGFDVLGHIGHSWGRYWNLINGGSYTDFSAGVSKDFAHFAVKLEGVTTSGYLDIPRNRPFSGATELLLSLSTTLPWT